MSGTIAVPGGTVANDILIAKVRSFWQDIADATPFDVPAGWTQLANSRIGEIVSADMPADTQGYASFWRVATASEPASYTFVAPASEQVMGGMWAMYSSINYTMNVLHSGTAQFASTPSYVTNVFHSVDAQSLMVYAFCGHGTAFSSFTGFVNARVHHGAGTLHSDTPFSSGSGVPPANASQRRDIVLSLDSEAGPFGTGSRTANANLSTVAGGYPYANTYVRIVEVAPIPTPTPWKLWVVN